MSKCTYNYNGVEYSELEFKKILKDLELPLSELSQEDLNLFKEHVMFIHDIQNYRLLNRYTVIHNNGYYDTAIRKVLIPVNSINKENILANIIKFKGLNPLFNLYHLFNEHTIKLIDSTPEIDSKDRLYEYRLAMLLQNNVENTWLNKLLLDLQIGINNTLNTNYDLEVIKNFLSHNINIVESQTVLPDTTESIDVESLLNQLGLDGKTEFEQEPNVEIVDFVTEIRQLANTDISNIQTQNQNKSNELIRLYRIENTNILYDESIEGIVSKREIIGQFFTDSINTVANYLKKNQKEDGINLVYVDIPKSDLDKYHVSNNEFSKTMDVESDNWIIPQSIARNYVDLSSVTKVTGNFLTLNKAKKELTEIINNLPEPKLNNNFIGNFSAEGRGTFEGDGKDKAMRNQAVGFIGELNPNKEDRFDSSTYGSFKHFNNNSIEEERYLENVPEDTSNGNKIMLALNGSIADTDILQKTKDKILELHNRGFEFLVGDMPGGENRIGDDKFIDYLKSIGANFTVFGSGNNSRILYQRVGLTEQQRKNIQELKQLEPAYAVASDEKVQEFIDTIYPDSKIKNLVFRGLSNKSDIVVNNNSYWTPSYRLAEDYIDRQQSTWENLLLDNNQNVEDIPDEKWNSFQPVLQIAVINSQNPYYNNNSVFELDNYENYDTTVGMVSDVQGLEPQILVYSKKQITILNSPETINRFNEFIGNTNPLINEKSLEEAKLPINVEKLFEDEKFANEVYESLGYKNDTTLPDDNKVHKILSDINKQHHLGNIIDLDGYPIYNSEDIIFQNGLKNITSNQWGHGATRIPYGKKGIERLENILSKSDRFTGDFGPIAGTELAKINQYPNTWESGRFIITRDDKDFYDKDGSLNINNIEIILNRSFEPYGNYLANKYPNIIFKDVFGNIIKISNQLTPKQKQEAIHLYSQYLKQNPNGDVENFKSWIEEFKNEIYESLGYDIRQLEEDNMITNLFLEARQDEDNKRINSGEFDDTKLDLKVELQDIIDNSTNPLLVELARSIQYNKSLNSIKAFSTQKPFITSDGFQPAAAYQAETQRLILFLGNKSRFANKERKYQYLLHELVHHFVDRQLILTYSSHANNIKELFKYAKDELTKLGKKILYGLQNAHEFVTEALTNPDFQRELKNLKVSDKFLTKVTSLFDYLLELISNILGTNQSVLEAVITQASDIFEIQEYKKSLSITPEQKQEALSLYSKYVELNPNGNIEEFKSWVNEFNNMTKLQGAYDFSASSNSGKWNSANNELLSLVQDNRKAFAIYKFLIGDMETFKEIVDYLNERGIEIPYTDRMKRADETMSEEERKSAIDSYNSSVDSKIEDKAQVEKNILSENNLQDETEYTPQELIEKYPLTGVQKVIWNLIKDVVNKLGIKIKFSSSRITESFDGSNNPQNGEILIRPSTLKNGRFGEVLVHEIVHALTTKIISRVNRGVTTGLTKKQISAVKGLMKLYEAVKKDNNLVDKYPVKDVFEFIAHLTNETFVKELESKDKNFLQKIVDFILDILGINNANELAKKYLLDIISDGTFLQENGITILPSDYGNNLQGSLSDFISQKSQEKKFEEKKVQIENEIKKLPIELQELISNNEFIQGAKLAFESSDLKDYGTLENYIDYIARISLGIIRNPTSGEFNNSVVKDIVYHGTDLKNKKNILNKGFQTNNKDLSIRDYIFFARSYNAYGNDAYGVSDKTLIPAVINSKKIQIIEDGTINNSDVKSLFNDKADTLLQILYDVNSYKQGKKLSYEQLEEIREKLELDGLNEIIKNIGFSKEKIIYELENNFESFMENYVNKYGVTNIPFGQLTIHKEQIHILGSKQDIEGFKDFVTQSSTTIKPEIQKLFNSNPELANSVYEALGFNNIIRPNDKIVWGHPAIGKTTMLESNPNAFIDWDNEFNRKRDNWIASKSNAKIGTPEFKKARNEYMINYNNHKDYVAFVKEEWNKTKEKANKENKTLIASPHMLLNLFPNDFDRVITMSDKTFMDRAIKRSGGDEVNSKLWKEGINKTLQSIDKSKIIETDKFINDLFITPQQKQQALQLYSQYLDTIFPDSKVKDIVYHGTDAKFDKFDKNFIKKEGVFNQQTNIKEGVPELFDSNPELANAVYEALGLKSKLSDIKPKVSITNYRNVTKQDKQNAVNGDIEAQKKWMIEEISEFYEAVDGFNNNTMSIDDVGEEVLGLFRTAQQFPEVKDFINPYIEDVQIALDNINKKEQYDKFKSKKTAKGQAEDMTFDNLFDVVNSFPNSKKQQALQLYSQYLDTIFPDSKVKDIVYRGKTENQTNKKSKELGIFFTDDKNAANIYAIKYKGDEFDDSIIQGVVNKFGLNPTIEQIKSEIAFFEKMGATKEQIEKDAKEFQKYILNNKGIAEQAIINIKNPKNLTVKDWFDNYDNSSSLKENSDGLLLKGGKQSDNRIYDAGENQIVVFEPEQIHILGSKQDIKGFKNWVSSTPQSTNVDENPNQTHIDKINAKYDAELAALEGNKSTTNDEYKLDYLINKTPIKAGVEELFDSNPELANQVYEALGVGQNIKTKKTGLLDYFLNVKKDSVFQELIQIGENLGIGIEEYESDSPLQANWNGKNVTINKTYGKVTSNVIAHEVVHGILHTLTNNDYTNSKLNLKLEKFKTELFDYIEKKGINNLNLPPELRILKLDYIKKMSNQEIVTYAFTDSQFSDFLASIKTDVKVNSNESFWNKLINVFNTALKELGFTSKLDELLDILNTEVPLFNNVQITPQQKQQALQQYSQYLDTIFPDSKVKDIVYHHSDTKLTEFKKEFPEGYAARHGVSPKAKFFLRQPLKEEFLSKRPYLGQYLVNIINPNVMPVNADRSAKRDSGIKEGIQEALDNNQDGAIFDNIWDNRTWSDVLVVFEPEQIHILGSKQDIKGFKDFVTQSSTTIKPEIQKLFNSNPELVNKVYETLGIKTASIEFKIEPFGKSIDNIEIFKDGKKFGDLQIVKNNKNNTLIVSRIEIREKGFGKYIYLKLQEQYPDLELRSDSKALSNDAVNMWDSFVKKGLAIKNAEKDYTLNIQQVIQLYSQYLDTGRGDIEGFKDFVNNKKNEVVKESNNQSLQDGLQWLKQIMPDVEPLLVDGLIDNIANGKYDILNDVITLSEDFANKGVVKEEVFHRWWEKMIPNQTEVENILNEKIENREITKDCKNDFKATQGLTTTTNGTNWSIIEDLKGNSHKLGGIDLTIGEDGISFKNNNSDIKAQDGLLIPSDKNKTNNYDNEFLNNWYKNRQIQDSYIQEAFELDKPEYLKKIEKYPEVKVVDKIDNNPNITGQYNKEKNEIYLTKDAEDSTLTHEQNHYINDFESYMKTIHDNIVKNEIKPIEDITHNGVKKNYDYLSNSNEIHSRIMILREKAGFKPNEFINEEKLDNYLKTYKGDVSNIEDLLYLMKDKKSLLNMLNYMAYNSNNNTENNA